LSAVTVTQAPTKTRQPPMHDGFAYRNLRAGTLCVPALTNLDTIRPEQSGDVVKIAALGAREKIAPFLCREFAKGTFGAVGIANQDKLPLTCYLDARTAVASM